LEFQGVGSCEGEKPVGNTWRKTLGSATNPTHILNIRQWLE